jgi:hypothetical protein
LHFKQGAAEAGDHEEALKRGVDVTGVAQVVETAGLCGILCKSIKKCPKALWGSMHSN